MSGSTTHIPSLKTAAGGSSATPRAKPEEVLSKTAQNFSRFKSDLENLRASSFPKFQDMFIQFLNPTFRESLKREAILLGQGPDAARFPFPGNPAEISHLDIVTTPGFYEYIFNKAFPRPERGEDVELYQVLLREHSDEMKARKSQGEKLFAYILTHLAEDSHAMVVTHGKFKTVQQNFNVAGLWMIIEEKHVGGESNLANKDKLRALRATKENFPCYEQYVETAISLVNQIKLGRGVVDEQELSKSIIDATEARLGPKDHYITQYAVAASEGRLPSYDVLLSEYMKYIQSIEGKTVSTATESDKDPNQAYVAASVPPENKTSGAGRTEKHCKNHPWATSHTTAECRANQQAEKKNSRDPRNKDQKSNNKKQRGRGRQQSKNPSAAPVVSFADILEDYCGDDNEAYVVVVEERCVETHPDEEDMPALEEVADSLVPSIAPVEIAEATAEQRDQLLGTIMEFHQENCIMGDAALPALEYLYEPKTDQTLFSGSLHHAFAGRAVDLRDRELILDLGANVGITHDTELLVDHRRIAPGTTAVRGVHGQAKQATHCGQLGTLNLGRAMVLPGANTELCSLPALLETHHDAICIGTTDNFTVYVPGPDATALLAEVLSLVQSKAKVLVSANRNPDSKLFTFHMHGPDIVYDDRVALPAMCIASDDPDFDPDALSRRAQPALQSVPMVSPRNYTAEERRRAMAVRILHKERGHPSDAVLATALDAHAYGNCPYTSADLRAANDIYGPCDACQQGKATWPEDHHPNQGPTPAIAIGELLHMDISFFNEGATYLRGGKFTLISVEHLTAKIHVRHLPSKEATKVLYPAVMDIVGWYRKYGHVVKKIQCDPESCFAALGPLLARDGVELVLLPPGIHDKITERQVRDIRARMRCTKADLAYEPPALLHGELCSSIVALLGGTPNSKTTPRSPDEILTGVKPVLPSVPIPWGTPVLATDPNGRADRSKSAVLSDYGIVVGFAPPNAWRIYFPPDKVLVRTKMTIKNALPSEFGWPARNKVIRPAPLHRGRTSMLLSQEPPRPANSPHITDLIAPDSEVSSAPALPAAPPVPAPAAAPRPEPASEGAAPAVPSPEGVAPVPVSEGASVSPSLSEGAPPSEGACVSSPPVPVGPPSVPSSPPSTVLPAQEGDTIPSPSATEVTSSPVMNEQPPLSTDTPTTPQRTRYERAAKKTVDYRLLHSKGKSVSALFTALVVTVGVEFAFLAQAGRQSLQRYMKTSPHPQRGVDAAEKEVVQLQRNGVGEPVHFSSLTPKEQEDTVNCFLFVLDKYNALGELTKTKARCVGNGRDQSPDSCGATTNATARPESLYITLALMALFDLEARNFDIPEAFIKTEVPPGEKIHVQLDPQCTAIWVKHRPQDKKFVSKGVLTLRLKKYLYGLKQSPNRFGRKLREFYLTRLGYKALLHDESFYYKKVGDHFLMIPVHVDDNYAVGTRGDNPLWEELRQGYQEVFGGFTEDDGSNFLGLHIEHKREEGAVYIDMRAYLLSLFDRYPELKDVRAYKTMADPDIFKDAPEDSPPVDTKRYLSMLMALYFPARFVKPNILVFLSMLARVRTPTEFHMRHLKHVYGFVRGTINQKIKIKPTSTRVGASIDSAFGLHSDGYSQSAMVLTIGQAPVGFYTKKQSTIATSSTEAETNALMEGIPRIKWARGLLEELGYPQGGPSEVSQDNKANIHLSSPDLPCSFRRTKHNIIKYAFIREQHSDGIIKTVQVPTDTISSDLLSKLVSGPSIPEKTDRLFGYLPTI